MPILESQISGQISFFKPSEIYLRNWPILLRDTYIHGFHMKADEQLVGFRKRCQFDRLQHFIYSRRLIVVAAIGIWNDLWSLTRVLLFYFYLLELVPFSKK